jgi:hypothetical protein
MEAILTMIGLVVTEAFEWAAAAVTFIVAQPLVMLFVGLPVVGLGIGFVMRLVRG